MADDKVRTLPVKNRTQDEQADAVSTVKRVLSGVTGYHDATRDARADRLEDFKFNQGGEGQWDPNDLEKLRREQRPVLTFNIVAPIINFVAGYQQEREQDYRAFPRGPEDEQLGRITTDLMRYMIDTCRGDHTFHKGFRQGLIGGQSIFEVSHSYELTDDLVEGDCNLELLEHDTWGHDIGARRYDRADAQYQFKLLWMPVDDAARRWKSSAAMIRQGMKKDWLAEDPTMTGVPKQMIDQFVDYEHDLVRILQYWYRVPVEVALVVDSRTGEVRRFNSETDAEKEIRRIFDTAGATAASQFAIQKSKSQSALIHTQTGAVHTYIKPEHAEEALDLLRKQAGQEAANNFELVVRPTTALRVSNVTAWEMLDDKPSPKGSDWRYPFVPFTVYQDTDNLVDIKGLTRDIKDPVREVNWHHSTILDTLMRGPKGGVWVNKSENADLDNLREKYSRAGFIGEYSGQPPIPVIPQALSDGDMAMLQFGIDAIMRITGINAEMMGQTTQKTVSGRAIQSRQAGGLVGLGSVFMNWTETKTLIGQLIIRAIQQYYSPEKMDRIIGQEQRRLKSIGLAPAQEIPPQAMYEMFKQLKQIDMDVVVSFQEASATARQAVATQMMQFKAAGAPIPLQLIIEASDVPFKEEIINALASQGEQPPSPELAKAVSAGQGQTAQPTGVNTTM